MRDPAPPIVLTIAGSDPSGGAGIQADLRAITVHRQVGAAVITAHTVQSGLGVRRVAPMDPAVVREQLGVVLADLPVAAVKVGMLGDGPVAEAVADALGAYGGPVVLDPVLVSSSGARLLDDAGVAVLRERLLPLATLSTPNLPEGAALLDTVEPDPDALAQALYARWGAVLLTGGHGDGERLVDRLVTGPGELEPLSAGRLPAPHDRGTGCLLSTSIACALARGDGLREAVQHGRACVRQGLRAAGPLGQGRGPALLLSCRSDRGS